MKNEKQIELSFIEKLKELKYIYREDIKDKASLEENFRKHFQELNRVRLSDSEFARLKESIITPDVFSAAKILRETNTFKRDDDTPLQYTLVNTNDWCKNEYEVINQLRINTENSHHRYDVIILINGIPVVQVELKSLQITPKRAMEQIVDYKNDPGNGYTNSLLCFMQLFIVSNESNTYYFANNNKEHFAFDADERFLPVYQFADKDNKKITHLHDFSEAVLRKCALGELISKYMVLVASEQKMMIMRPYQIYAVKAIMDCIEQNRGNGYIWHTTGSGKTLTSFKASTLLKDNRNIAKCLFVVDRKDLDRQTREEFNKFQEGCVEENTNTETLVKRLVSEDYRDKVIVTTIQKLGLALDDDNKRSKEKKKKGELTYKERLAPLKDSRIAIIFDECHRSQFGENHKAIKNFFPKAQLFGFTGTPIFEENATYKQIDGTIGSYTTTKDIFEKELHAYTITHAIDDRNVLRFHIDYFKPQNDRDASRINEEQQKKAVVQTILSKHDAITNNRRYNANLARMNMLLHGVKDSEFQIHHGDSLLNDWNILNEMNPAKKMQFEAVVANPPFSYRWQPKEEMAEDFRFKNYGLAPKSAADFAFLLHGFHFLSDDGTMAIILPHGVLFRGGTEEKIRTKLLKDGNIDAIIGLPANLFFSTGIPVCILVLKKCKKYDDVLIINASEYFEKGKRQNTLLPEHIDRIIETYQYRKEDDKKYSRRVSMEEIEKNGYNLNISRYVSTAPEEEIVDIEEVRQELEKIENDINVAKARHNEFLKELGLNLLP